MSFLERVSRPSWLLIGILIAVIVIPTTAVAAALSDVIIKGATGNKALVTVAGQLLATEANPRQYVQTASTPLGQAPTLIASPPRTTKGVQYGLIVKIIHVDVESAFDSLGAGIVFTVNRATSECDAAVGTYRQIVHPSASGEIDIPMDPGLVVYPGDALCGYQIDEKADASISGYAVSSADTGTSP